MKIHHWGFLLLMLCTALVMGRSDSESGRDESPAHQGSAKLVFFQRGAPYHPAVDVVVRSEKGRPLIATTARGPWLVVSLPEGWYTVRAQRESGQVRNARFRVESGQRQEVSLRFVRGH
ncbi:hypothetical protein F6455_17565 [Proteobacteria bacterium 005FR1]|nr:hypothetical protein [Proteobacteria bacterium 005FR1]